MTTGTTSASDVNTNPAASAIGAAPRTSDTFTLPTPPAAEATAQPTRSPATLPNRPTNAAVNAATAMIWRGLAPRARSRAISRRLSSRNTWVAPKARNPATAMPGMPRKMKIMSAPTTSFWARLRADSSLLVILSCPVKRRSSPNAKFRTFLWAVDGAAAKRDRSSWTYTCGSSGALPVALPGARAMADRW